MALDIESPRPVASKKVLDGIRSAYGMQFEDNPKDLGGSRNLNLLLNAGNSKYVARIYRDWISSPRLEAIQMARQALNTGGVPSSTNIPTLSREKYTKVDGCLIEVEEYVEHSGNMNTWERLAIGLPWLGRVHNILSRLVIDPDTRQPVIANHLGSEDVWRVTEKAVKQIRSWKPSLEQLQFAKVAESLAQRLQEAERPFISQLPIQLVHGDFWDNNVFFRDNKVILVTDLDFMGERPRIDDLALTLYYTNSTFLEDNLSDDRIRSLKMLIDAYNSELDESLSMIELRALPLAIARTPLFMMRYFALMRSSSEAAEPINSVLPDLEWALKIVADLDNWQRILMAER